MMSGQELLSELSFRSGLSIPEVEKELKKWRKKAESNSANKPAAISGVGTFKANQDGSIIFTADSLLLELVNYRYTGWSPIALNRDSSKSTPIAEDKDSSEKSVPSPDSSAITQTKESEKSSKSSSSVQPKPAKSKKKSLFAVGLLLVISLVATAWFLAPKVPFLDSFVTDKREIAEGSTALPPSSDPVPIETASEEPSLYGLFGEFNEELSGSFTISVFSFSDIDNASEQASVLLSDGYRLHIRNLWDGNNTIWQLTIGQFETREDAEIALQTLSSPQFSETRIISYP